MKKKELTAEFIMEGWLLKYHGLTMKQLMEKEPELVKTPEWYKKYAVTQAQHDEWYEWAISVLAKSYHTGKVLTRRRFCFDYLNLAPSVI